MRLSAHPCASLLKRLCHHRRLLLMPSRQPSPFHDQSRASVLSQLAGAVLADLTDEQMSVLARRLRPHLDDQAPSGRLLSPVEAAARLSIHVKTLTRAARQGRVPGARRVGRVWRFDASQLDLEPVKRASTLASSSARPRRRAHDASSAVDAIRSGRGRDR
ncbi:MAG: helix-turn-helix domain-containing protein [Conexibacter sp.]